MKDIEQRQAAKAFSEYWQSKGYEKGESQPFWLELLGNVFGVENPAHYISFENQVQLDHTSFIDGFIPSTHVLIEQKGIGKDLRKAIRQSDGTQLTPFQQAQRYSASLPYSQRPRWIVACNFEEFLIYDMEKPNGEPESLLLKDLEKEYYRLQFLVDKDDTNIQKEMELSIKAGKIVGELYDSLLKQYINPENEHSLKSLNMLCVRLVFCLYAEDAGIFGGHSKFYNYLSKVSAENARDAIIKLFKVLDTKPENRDPYLDKALLDFPYVNGGLFADGDIEIPNFTEDILVSLLKHASSDFDWSGISPTIFGAVFESTLNPETRRSGGMHYTSIENIHKVIDPLFLDDLKTELGDIKSLQVGKMRDTKLNAFRDKLSSLTFLDPACGSGNFLTETYMSLRKLENEILRLQGNQITLDTGDIIKVSIGQFYGIEINDFAVTVAKTALWIAESQMLKETEDIVMAELDFLPLKSYANIAEGNALRMDWEEVVPKNKLNYIMGNPPFVGFKFATKSQKSDMEYVFSGKIKPSLLDFVCGWYEKASEYIQGTFCEVAFVSTNSISQGQMAGDLWSHLLNTYKLSINFAYQSFVWKSEVNDTAKVHVVIVGFASFSRQNKMLYSNMSKTIVNNISPYLINGENILITSRKSPISNVPPIIMGNQAMDGGNLIIESKDYDDFVKREPKAKPFIKQYMMGNEFINNKKRYCLWLVNCSPSELRKMPLVVERVNKVREMRLASNDSGARKKADTPMLFREQRNPETFIAIPIVSSERRRYIPIGYLDENTIAGNKLFIIPDATLYHFGVLTSNVHMAWMRTVCGRLKSDYTYSKDIVYNNFPWPPVTPRSPVIPSLSRNLEENDRILHCVQNDGADDKILHCVQNDGVQNDSRAKIEKTAQAILDARALYPDCSLADLYDELTMPKELRKAHQDNDRAVMQAYGFDIKNTTESSCVAELMKMYQEMVDK